MRAIIIPTLLGLAAAAPLHAQRATCYRIPRQAAEAAGPGAAADSLRAVRQIRQALENDLRDAAREAGIAEPQGVVIAERRGQEAPRVWSHGSNVPEELVRTVVARHTEALARWPGRDRLVNLRLDHVPVPENATRACMPVLLDPRGLARELARIDSWPQSGALGQSRRITLYLGLLVTRDGDVAYAELRRFSSVSGQVESELVQVGRRLRFRPATVGNVPVDTWVEQPVNLTLQYE